MSSNKQNLRKEKDVMKLLVSEYSVNVTDEKKNNEFLVKMPGPKDSLYEGVIIKISLILGNMASKSNYS